MSSIADFRRSPFTSAPVLRRAAKYFGYTSALLVALIAYCELCSFVTGYRSRTFAMTVEWAVQVSAGWILIGAALGSLGERMLKHAFVQQHPRQSLAYAVVAIGTFALLSEVTIASITDSEGNIFALLYQRIPLSFASSGLLIAAFLGNRAMRRRRAHHATAVPDTQCTEHPVQRQASSEDARTIDVMTGTGRTNIRVAEIECLAADGNYINVVHASGRTYLLRQTMAAVERSLDPAQFVRVHRSMIVNVRRVKERRNGSVLVLESGRTVKVSRAFRDRALAGLTRPV